MLDLATLEQAHRLLQACREQGWQVVTAESCTGGLIAAALTHYAGSSDVVERGLVTYSNAAKTALLGVSPATLELVGAVSEEVAREMATGALARSGAHLAIAVTGIAGPGGGSPGKPVGTVHIAVSTTTALVHERHQFDGDRAMVRLATVAHALKMALGLATAGSRLA